MSKIIKEVEDRVLGHVIQTNDGKMYYVDSANTFDAGYETMVFPWNEELAEVDSWGEVYAEWHDTFEDMVERHDYIINNFEDVLEFDEES